MFPWADDAEEAEPDEDREKRIRKKKDVLFSAPPDHQQKTHDQEDEQGRFEGVVEGHPDEGIARDNHVADTG